MSNKRNFERAAAEAYAQIPAIESACYHYLTDNFSEHHKATLRNHFMPVLLLQGIKPKYVERVVMTALVELTYPVDNEADQYAWSGCQRSAFCGIPQKTWSRNKLCDYTKLIIDTIRSNADRASLAIRLQMMDADGY